MATETRRARIIIGIVFVLALGLRLWGADWGLPLIQHEGEKIFIEKAIGLGETGVKPYGLWPLPFDIYYFIGHLRGDFSTYKEFQIEFVRDPSNFLLIGRIVGAFFSAGVCLLLWRLGKTLENEWAGLAAALLWAISTIAIREAHLAMPINLSIFFSTLFLYFIALLKDRLDKRFAWGAGFSAAFATVTTGNPLYMLLTFVIFTILFYGVMGFRNKNWGELWPVFFRTIGGTLIGLPIGCTMGLICPYCIFSITTYGLPSQPNIPFLKFLSNFVFSTPLLGMFLLFSIAFFQKEKEWGIQFFSYFSLIAFVVFLFCPSPHFERFLFLYPLFSFVLIATSLKRSDFVDREFIPTAIGLFLFDVGLRGLLFYSDFLWLFFLYFGLPLFLSFFIITLLVARDKSSSSHKWLHYVAIGGFFLLNVVGSLAFINTVSRPTTIQLAQEWAEKNIPAGSTVTASPWGPHLTPLPQSFSSVPTTPGKNPFPKEVSLLLESRKQYPQPAYIVTVSDYKGIDFNQSSSEWYIFNAYDPSLLPLGFIDRSLFHSGLERVFPVRSRFSSLESGSEVSNRDYALPSGFYGPSLFSHAGPTILIYKKAE